MPALAFVKSVCHLLALDNAVTDEVLLLRRQLLRLVHCKEFSPSSEFKVSRQSCMCGGEGVRGTSCSSLSHSEPACQLYAHLMRA